MRFSDKLRQDAEQHQEVAHQLTPLLNEANVIKAELLSLAEKLPVNQKTPHINETREQLLDAIRRLPTNQGERIVQATVGMVMAKIYWLFADFFEYMLGKNMLAPPKSDAAMKRHELNQQMRMATVKGFADGDWSGVDRIVDRLITGAPEAGEVD